MVRHRSPYSYSIKRKKQQGDEVKSKGSENKNRIVLARQQPKQKKVQICMTSMYHLVG
jgi:hypothetical protein